MEVTETIEEVLADLHSLDFAELRLMCVHRNLSTAGDEKVLLHRLKSYFGFEVEPLESKSTSEATKSCNEEGRYFALSFYRSQNSLCYA